MENKDLNKIVYRCGWCGNITDKIGMPLSTKLFLKATKILQKDKDCQVIKIDGNCCRHEFNY